MEYSHNKGRLGYTYASIKLDTICFSIARSVHKNPKKNGRDVMLYVNVCFGTYVSAYSEKVGGPVENRTPNF